jgi:Protein of unknown function (DUF2721)
MTIEQTSQLIQLILNSVLMMLACVGLLSVLLMRHIASVEGLRTLNREYLALLTNPVIFKSDRLTHLKHLVQLRKRRHRAAHNGIVVIFYALLLFTVSTFGLSLRTLIAWDGLIQLALNLFIAGLAMFLFGVGLAVLDFQRSKRSLWDELSGTFSIHSERSPADKPRPGITHIQIPRHLPPAGGKVSSMR